MGQLSITEKFNGYMAGQTSINEFIKAFLHDSGMKQLAKRITKSSHLMESAYDDLMQETAIVLLNKLETIKNDNDSDESKIIKFIHGVMRIKAKDIRRKNYESSFSSPFYIDNVFDYPDIYQLKNDDRIKELENIILDDQTIDNKTTSPFKQISAKSKNNISKNITNPEISEYKPIVISLKNAYGYSETELALKLNTTKSTIASILYRHITKIKINPIIIENAKLLLNQYEQFKQIEMDCANMPKMAYFDMLYGILGFSDQIPQTIRNIAIGAILGLRDQNQASVISKWAQGKASFGPKKMAKVYLAIKNHAGRFSGLTKSEIRSSIHRDSRLSI